MRKNLYLISGILFIGILTLLSLKESISFTSNFFSFTDKILHFGAYVMLTFLWSRFLMLQKSSYSLKKILTIVGIFLIIYGIIVEILQTELTKNRVGEVEDVIANMLGILIGAIIFQYVIKWKLNCNKGLFF